MPKGAKRGTNNGGGPKSEEGLAAIAAAASVSSTRHGVYRMMSTGMVPGCDRCLVAQLCEEFSEGGVCVQAARATDEIMTRVMAAEHITELSRDQVRVYAKMMVLLEIIEKHLVVDGMFRGDDQGHNLTPAPLLDVWQRVSANALGYAKELGLTPATQSRLKLHRADGPMQQMLTLFAELEQETRERNEREEQLVIEGDFGEEA